MSGKITFVIVKNALEPEVNQTVQLDFEPGKIVSSYLVGQIDTEDVRLVVAVNGEITEEYDSSVLADGDIVSVAAYYEAAAIAAWVATAVGATAGTIAYYAVYGVAYIASSLMIMYGMKMVISALGLGPNAPDTNPNADQSPTYSWGEMTPTYNEGQPIPIVFGTHKVAGQVLNQFTQVHDDGKEYLYTMLAVNDGSVDSISDIRINDQPYSQYSGVTVYSRLGTLDQTPVPGFDEITETHGMNVMLRTNVNNSRTTDGDQVEKITVVLTCPAGLFYTNDEGELDTRSVDVLIQYRAQGGFWMTHKIERISGATTQSIRRAVVIDDLTPAQYEVRVIRGSSETTSSREKTDCYWTSISESVKQSLCYPGIALYAVVALATDQLSGSAPTFTCVVEKSMVSVFNPYSALWVEKSSSNPAWATYGLMNNHHEIPDSKIIYDEFDAWASYCDEQINDKPRFTFGMVIDTQTNIWSNVQRIARIGRATVMRRGSSYGVFLDAPVEVASHVFNMSNIIDGSYSLKYLPLKDRANAIEVTYSDPDRDYSNQIAAVYSDDYNDSSSVDKKTSVQILAAIPRSQAFREAAYYLNSNRRLDKTIVIKAAFDSFTCRVGDVAFFQHVVPNFDSTSGGRIISAINLDGGKSRVQLDRAITLEAGTAYGILIRLSDDTFVEKMVQAVTTTHETNVIDLSGSFTTLPQEDDLFIFGQASTYKKKYRVIRVAKDQQNIASISLLTYDDAIYEADGFAIEEDAYNLPVTQQAIHVTAAERLVYTPSGDFASVIDVNWSSATEDIGSNWSVFIEDITSTTTFSQTDGGQFVGTDDLVFSDAGDYVGAIKVSDTTSTHITIPSSLLTFGQRYKITVAPYGSGAIDTGSNAISVQVLGKAAPPSDVVLLHAEWDSARRSVVFTWPEIPDIDAAGYEIRQKARGYGASWNQSLDSYTAISTDADTWENSEVISRVGLGSSWVWLVPVGTIGVGKFWIKSIDTSGIYSENAASATVEIDTATTTIEVPTGLELSTSASIAADGTAKVFIFADWDSNAELSEKFAYYAVQLEDIASGRVTDHVAGSSEYQWEVIGNKQYSARVQAIDANGNRTAWCEDVSITAARDTGAPGAPQWKSTPLVPGFKVIALQWVPGTEPDLSHYQVQRSATGLFDGEEVSLGNKAGSFTTDTDLDVSAEYYYRIRAVDTSGNASGWSSVQSATTLTIGSEDIAYKSVLAEHIDVETLSAITANIGDIIAGILRSEDYDADSGMQIDLTNGTIKLGGSTSPAFEWDGTEATIRNNAEGQSLELSGTQITLGDTTDGDYFRATNGDIQFFRYINGVHQEAKSLKRIETGVATNGVSTSLGGGWKYPPSVIVSPYQLAVYSAAYASQTQTLFLSASTPTESPVGSGNYVFTPNAQLLIGAGSTDVSVNNTDTFTSISGAGTPTTGTYTTSNNVDYLTVTGSTELHIIGHTDHWGGSYNYKATGSFTVYVNIDGNNHNVGSYSGSTLSDYGLTYTLPFSFSIGLTPGIHTIYCWASANVANYLFQQGHVKVTFSNYTARLASSSVLATGTLNYMAISR